MPPFLQGWEEHSFLSRIELGSSGGDLGASPGEDTPHSVQQEEGEMSPEPGPWQGPCWYGGTG